MTQRARQDATTTAPAERVRSAALAMLDRAPRSAADLRSRLLAKGFELADIDPVIDRYIEVGLLADAQLAATIARTRHLERGLAAHAIAAELRRKGFEEQDIADALGAISSEDHAQAARELALRRWNRLGQLDVDVKTRRVVGFLARKGHSPSLAFALVNELIRADNATGGPGSTPGD